MEAELLDWELVHGSDTESTDSFSSEKNQGSSSVIGDDGVILPNHFSATTDQSCELGFDQSGVSDACVGNELGSSDVVSDSEPARESQLITEDDASETDHVQVGDDVESQSGVEEPIVNEMVSGDNSRIVNGQEEIGSENTVDIVAADSVESKIRETTVWWKMPFVLVKYSAFRIGPFWSLSMAAALMGFLFLGRRLYNIKKKPQRIHLKVAIDYKKVSQVMNQAARLNEAFTEVRRVPVIRPALPAPGGAWPVLSLR